MGTWTRVPAKKASEVCARFQLGAEARPLLNGDAAPEAFLVALAGAGQLADAARFLAHALPKREALWWACQCVRQADATAAPEQAAALAAAEKYVEVPTDTNRRAAMAAAEAADFGTPAGCAAAAAFFSAGSLAPPGLAPVEPAEHLTPAAVANAVVLATIVADPHKADEKYRLFLDLGRAVAEGKSRWKDGQV